jgi:hypothetical protein
LVTGRQKIVLAGLWMEMCVAFPTVQAIHDGYEVYGVEDLCGDLDEKTHLAAMRRVEQAGAKPRPRFTPAGKFLRSQRTQAQGRWIDRPLPLDKTIRAEVSMKPQNLS